MVINLQDDPSAFDLLVCCPHPLSRFQVNVDFSSAYDREPHPDAQMEEAIEKTWAQRTAYQPSLVSAKKFRYGGVEEVFVKDEGSDQQKVYLRLGLTDYKTFLGTNMSRNWKQVLVSSATDDVDRCIHTASPLGNGAIVETIDHHILILQRNINVRDFPENIVFPEGLSKPGMKTHTRQMVDKNRVNNAIVQEMFDGVTREIVEEIGVSSATLSDPVFIGISRRTQNARPTAFFYVTCSLSSEDVLETYRKADHTFESTVLISSSPDALLEAGKKMPGGHHGGAALYQLMREARLDTLQ